MKWLNILHVMKEIPDNILLQEFQPRETFPTFQIQFKLELVEKLRHATCEREMSSFVSPRRQWRQLGR